MRDAKVIAQLVKYGRYAVPNLPQGIYAELQEALKIREHLTTDLCVVQACVHNWLDWYFPVVLTVFKDWECQICHSIAKPSSTAACHVLGTTLPTAHERSCKTRAWSRSNH
ncbi:MULTISPECIES: hypothetical protein [Paenibacillus]|uniref:hypothetical protein n=1 Tax=Paenibacillus TaxID=44249 RepID=UPI0037C91415